jgi:predicted ATPase
MLQDQGLLREEDGQWVLGADLAKVTIPPSISALLEARIDRLEAGERDLVGRASVVGKEFDRAAVAALHEADGLRELDPRLRALARKEFIVPEPIALDAFSFRHVLIRDAAYLGLAKRLRAELHERFAEWLASGAGPRLIEVEEIVGYHFEQAFRFRAELGPVTEQALSLAERAAGHLSRAGQRALSREDLPAGVSLLTRATHLMRPDDPLRLELQGRTPAAER